MEGQYQVRIPRTWATENDIGGIKRLVADKPIEIRNEKIDNLPEGRENPNAKIETFLKICEYIKCRQDKTCIDAFAPFGHCCEICGASLDFSAHKMNINVTNELVSKVLSDLQLSDDYFFTTEKVSDEYDNDHSMYYEYQIVIMPEESTPFDEDTLQTIAEEVAYALESFKNNGELIALSISCDKSAKTPTMLVLDMKVFFSKFDRTVQLISYIEGISIVVFIIAIFAGKYVQNRYESNGARMRSFVPIISWQRNHDEEEDRVHLELHDASSVMELPCQEEILEPQVKVQPNKIQQSFQNENFDTSDIPMETF
ncbi:unnamed protein product [Caenorhabditis bovis]|uniref:Protein amnionless n=1 Tax=Caenorhabditis bovis TaxID=2654633 RepID=A0A8S1E8X0_9PELO|nr:unnamed protein product [Caenorhabditis bovis]